MLQVVRTYKEPHYILDSGGHQKGTRGLSAYLLNNNLYFSVAMSTDEDTLTWTVRTSIFTVRSVKDILVIRFTRFVGRFKMTGVVQLTELL